MSAGRGCEERGTLMHYWWEYKLMHLLQRPKLWPLDLKSQKGTCFERVKWKELWEQILGQHKTIKIISLCLIMLQLYVNLSDSLWLFYFPKNKNCVCVSNSVTPWTAARQASLSFTISRSLLKLMSIESVKPFKHPILCRPFSSWPHSFPAGGSFPMSWLFKSSGQSFGLCNRCINLYSHQ